MLFSLALAACGSGTNDGSPAVTTAAPTTVAAAEVVAETTTSAASSETESGPGEATASTEPPPVPSEVLEGGLLAPAQQRTNWVGVIDDDIEFTMWLAQNGSHIRGELTYSTSGQPITVIGQSYENGESYLLREFGADGRVSGTMILGSVANGEVTNTTWDDRDLLLTFDGVGNDPYVFDPLVRKGAYTYAFGPFISSTDEPCCGPTGNVQISGITDTSVMLSIENVNSGPGFNQAIIAPTRVPLSGNVARFEMADDDFIDCAFDLIVYDGFLFIEHVDERFDCGFGNAAGVAGIYVLTADVVDPQDSTFFDAELTSTAFGGVELGDTWSSLTERFAVPPFVQEDDDFFAGCYYVQVPNDLLSPWFMMLGEGNDAVVSRIELALETQRTNSGIGIGDTEADVDAIYGDAVLKDQHTYLGEGAKYLRVVPTSGTESTLLFETNETGEIIAVRNGFLEPVRWVEGCA